MPTKDELRTTLSSYGITAPTDATKSELEALLDKHVPDTPPSNPGSKRALADRLVAAGATGGLSYANLVGKPKAVLEEMLADVEDEGD